MRWPWLLVRWKARWAVRREIRVARETDLFRRMIAWYIDHDVDEWPDCPSREWRDAQRRSWRHPFRV